MQSDVWGGLTSIGISYITGGNFAQSSITANGWLKLFMAEASQVIQYSSALSAYRLMFLGPHSIWAFS